MAKSIGVNVSELELRISNATGALEEIEILTPEQEYKTDQLEKFKELHQRLYSVTQDVKTIIRNDLDRIFMQGMERAQYDNDFARALINWDGRHDSNE